jgi:hypothetical protein
VTQTLNLKCDILVSSLGFQMGQRAPLHDGALEKMSYCREISRVAAGAVQVESSLLTRSLKARGFKP